MEIDEIVFRTDLVTVGRFRCPTQHAHFRDSGPIRQSCFVFPRTSVVIEHEGRRPFVTDSTIATLYNTGQRYERRPIHRDGDRCDWFAVSDDLLRDAVRPFDPEAADNPRGAMRFANTFVPSLLYLEQRRLFTRITNASDPDPLETEELVIALLGRVIGAAYRGRPSNDGRHQPRAAAQNLSLSEAVRERLARSFRNRVTLGALAQAVGCSPFHLSRAFRSVTGSTIHEHLMRLRVRTTLEDLTTGASLSDVALAAGFSSHSHFTAAFRRAFGTPPSRAFRARF